MKNKLLLKKVFVSFLSFLMIFTIFNNSFSQVNANELDTKVSFETVQQLDKYVFVENNQFKLVVPNDVKIDDQTVKTVNQQIGIVNKKIVLEKAIINLEDKSITFGNEIELRSGNLPAHEIDKFWWGVRHIFRTKTASNEFTRTLENAALGISVAGAISTVFGPGGTVVAGLGATYFKKMADDVKYMKSKHKKIELNVTWAGVYRVIEWKGK